MIYETKIYKYRWMILAIAWIAYFVMYLQRFAIPPLSPFIQEDFMLTRTQVGFLMSVNGLGYVIMQMPGGWLVDRIGVAKMLLIGEVFTGIMMTGMCFTPSYKVSLILLGLGGLGCGCLLTATSKAIMLWFPIQERGTAMGLKQTSCNLGGVLGALTLPTLAIAFGWRYGFGIVGIIAITVGITSFFLYKDHPSEKNQPEPSFKKPGDNTSGLMRDILFNRELILLGIVGACFATIEFSAITYIVTYLKETMLFSVVIAGGFLAVFEGAGAFGKPLFGLLSDRFFNGSRKKAYFLISIIIFIACVIMALLPSDTPKWSLYLVFIIFGLGANGWSGVHFTFVGESVNAKSMGLAMGMTIAVSGLSIVTGPPLFGYIVDRTGEYTSAWYFLALCSIISIILIIFIREKKKKYLFNGSEQTEHKSPGE